ncbi:type-i n-myristoyltransferase with bound myristoyl-CoA and inhibitor ddd85646 [Blyttiomyces helicus]|uniref:Glycylpeptide N-tetradecanoyltransferase n=1 Tax=Blyttiomyces helicus TaxID=388810 RepID=A0A4P9WHK7_9FUNG|nr:type-i n-myristoyltransferase with bound myristoyl-CoA and inhibitor ddd85646 [Blyttiomyces helicus]|eukprot:RKO90580.1 type-i n-myristoyltransferase with bound myristoyl-CoA and inhibitor ddd85646 [Blyttiomyces helicus]
MSKKNIETRSSKQPKLLTDHRFWQTQPVVNPAETVEENGPIVPDLAPDEVRKEPYPLPKEFEWSLIELGSDKEVRKLYELLSANYVEDDDAMFRFDYSANFLKWALLPPGFKKSWHIGVRVVANKKLVAFISGIPADPLVYQGRHERLVEINFLCVHKKLRSKRLAPVMIKEITRRVNLEGIFQATYTAGVHLPTPMATCRYYHRSLNPKKLIETSFSPLSRNTTMQRTIRLYKLPDATVIPGLRPMVKADVSQVTELLNKYQQRFSVAQILSAADVAHWLLPVEGVIQSYVGVDRETGAITDFVSFYSLPSTVIGHPMHSHINATYLFYYVPKGLGADMKRLQTLIKDALILAKKSNHDVFNCLDLGQNGTFIEDLKFGRGDGNLHYYLYNYRCKPVVSEGLALVLL